MEAATARLGRGRKGRKQKSYGSEERRLATLLLSPAMAVIVLVAAYPIGYAVWLSLTEYSLRTPGKWRFAGFDNYTEAFGSTEFWDAVRTTFLFTGISVTLELAIGLGIALAVMVLADVWKTAPFMALLLLAGLQVIPDDVYDAAKVDGATAWQRFRRITLPLLVPAILVALIFRTLDALRIFDLPFVLTGGTNGTSTLSLIAQQELTTNNLIGYGSALSVLTFVIVMGVSFIYIRTVGGNIKSLAEDT